MIIEVLEFCILDRLSIELEDYFRRTDTNFENLEKKKQKPTRLPAFRKTIALTIN